MLHENIFLFHFARVWYRVQSGSEFRSIATGEFFKSHFDRLWYRVQSGSEQKSSYFPKYSLFPTVQSLIDRAGYVPHSRLFSIGQTRTGCIPPRCTFYHTAVLDCLSILRWQDCKTFFVLDDVYDLLALSGKIKVQDNTLHFF